MSNNYISVVATEGDNGFPMFVICSEFNVPLTSKTFLLSLYNFLHDDRAFKINTLKGCNLSFELNEAAPEPEVDIYFKKMFVGTCGLDELKFASDVALKIFYKTIYNVDLKP